MQPASQTASTQSTDGSFWLDENPLILASASKIRHAMLNKIQINCTVKAPQIDERELEKSLDTRDDENVACALSQAKAVAVSKTSPDHYVLGADQTCYLDQIALYKPDNQNQLRSQLKRMSGKTHKLFSAATVVKNGEILTTVISTATLTMRTLSESFVEWYIHAGGNDLFQSVGGYRIEDLGQTLMARTDGDIHSIMGLPLLPLLDEFRRLGLVRS